MTVEPIVCRHELLDRMISLSKEAGDREACGLVAFDGAIPVAVRGITNVESDPTRFLMEPRELYEAITTIEGRGWEIGGVFHSHPSGPAVPSETDLAAPLDSRWMAFIVSGQPDWCVRAFRLDNGRFQERPIVEAADRAPLR